VVVCGAPDNAATELVQQGVNGAIAGPEPADIAERLLEVLEAGTALRERTAEWFRGVSAQVSAEASIARVREAYSAVSPTA
jgi:hypothetical protein